MPDGLPPRVYWDACVFLDYISEHPDRYPTIEALLEQADQGKRQVLTSVTTIAEVAFAQQEKAAGSVSAETEKRIDALWMPPSPVTLVEFHVLTARTARALLREAVNRGWGLKPFDAIHLATAKLLGVTQFNTYDLNRLGKYGELIGTKVCEPYIEQTSLPLGEAAINKQG